MTDEQCRGFRIWFSNHVRSYRETDISHQRNLALKEEHTHRVCAAMERITVSLGLPANVRRIAATTALFHDLGRFPQYRRYRTFRDPDSSNHARLSLLELHRHRVLHLLEPSERHLISRAIILHNRHRLPARLDPDTLLLSRLLRDADKLDILRVMAEHFNMPEDARDPVITLGLEQKGGVRQEAYRRFFAGRIMSYGDLATTDEFKLLLLSWVFDLNFQATFEILREQDHIGAIAATLPDTSQNRQVTEHFRACIERQLADRA